MVQVRLLEDAAVMEEITDRLGVLEKYGIYTTLADLKQAVAGSLPYYLLTATGKSEYVYKNGDFTGKADDEFVIKLDNTPINTGALVRQNAKLLAFLQNGTGAVNRSLETKTQEIVSVNDFGAKGDNVFDNTAAINMAIVELCKRGGGRLVFGSALVYYVAGTILLPSNITFDLSSEVLRGGTGDLFQSAWWNGSVVTSNVNDGDEVNIVQNSKVINGIITDAHRVFNLKNFNQECVLADLRTRNCQQVGYYKRCFASSVINVSARAGSSVSVPTHHFDQQANAILLDRVECVTEYGFLFTNGANGVDIRGWRCEGGTKGFVFQNDCLNISFTMGYGEALSGTLFDFSAATACSAFWQGNYINGVNVCFDDGGASATSTLHGMWLHDNERVNSTGNGYNNLMYVSGPRNYINWHDRPVDNSVLSNGSGWVQGLGTIYHRLQRWNADGLVDVRSVASNFGSGVVPRVYGGNVGQPFPGTIPWSTYTLMQGAVVNAAITTQIVLQNDASAVHFIITITDNDGTMKVSGTVYGDHVHQVQGLPARPVTLSQNAQGKLVLTIAGINNTNGAVTLTGSVWQG